MIYARFHTPSLVNPNISTRSLDREHASAEQVRGTPQTHVSLDDLLSACTGLHADIIVRSKLQSQGSRTPRQEHAIL